MNLPQEANSVSQRETDVIFLSGAFTGSGHLPNTSVKDNTEKGTRNNISEQNKVGINKKRHLTFSPIISTVVGTGTGALSREDYTVQEKRNCWWAVDEISRSRAHAKRVITLIKHSGRGYVTMIDDSFKLAQQLSTSLLETEMDALMQDPNNFRSQIDASEFNGHGRRGLERRLSVFQQMTGREIREMVLQNQRMEVSSEEVAEKYAEECLASRIYARWMGRVDYKLAYVL
jgi:hypothetical protein